MPRCRLWLTLWRFSSAGPFRGTPALVRCWHSCSPLLFSAWFPFSARRPVISAKDIFETMNSTASEWMKGYVWPEIQAMMLNDAHFKLVLAARQLTKKFNGPTAKLLPTHDCFTRKTAICPHDDSDFAAKTLAQGGHNLLQGFNGPLAGIAFARSAGTCPAQDQIRKWSAESYFVEKQ
jgi:hypothetical protein